MSFLTLLVSCFFSQSAASLLLTILLK